MLFCSPGDKETKLCAGEGGRICAYGVHQGTSCAAAFTASAFSWWEGAGLLFIAAMDRNLLAGHVHKCCHPPREGFFTFYCSLPACRITCIPCTSVPGGARAAAWPMCRRHCLPASFWSEMISVYALLCMCALRGRGGKHKDSVFFPNVQNQFRRRCKGKEGGSCGLSHHIHRTSAAKLVLKIWENLPFRYRLSWCICKRQLCPCSVWMKSCGAASAVLLLVINQVSSFYCKHRSSS